MARTEDPGFCLMGATSLLHHVTELKAQTKAAKDMDVEGVHQMRVASRRLRAGLPIFSSCFKLAQYDRWRQGIKGVTKALGEARDIDVQVEYLQSLLTRAPDEQRPELQIVLDHTYPRVLARIDHSHMVTDCAEESLGLDFRSGDEIVTIVRALQIGPVHMRYCFLLQTALSDVGNDSDETIPNIK
jgi:hypothetical protein